MCIHTDRVCSSFLLANGVSQTICSYQIENGNLIFQNQKLNFKKSLFLYQCILECKPTLRLKHLERVINTDLYIPVFLCYMRQYFT